MLNYMTAQVGRHHKCVIHLEGLAVDVELYDKADSLITERCYKGG